MGLKPYPVEGMTPAMVQAAIELRAAHPIDPAEVEAIRIYAHEEAVTKPSWDEHKFAPLNKETADHSFYYCTAVALVAGEYTSAQFSDTWLKHPAAVEVQTRRGTFTREVLYPKGDPNNPMTWDDVTQKFRQQAEPVLGSTRAGEIVERCRAIEKEADMRAFASSLSGG